MNQLQPIEFNNQRILTTEQLAKIYETDANNIKNNFNRNKGKFEQGKHYFYLEGAELKAFKNCVTVSDAVDKHTKSLYLWTERGANRHCKILDTDKAWEQFDVLEETYFKIKDGAQLPQSLAQALRLYADALERQEKLLIGNKQKEQIIGELKPKADYLDKILQSKALVNINQIAKDYGMTAIAMNKLLYKLRVQYKQGEQWLLYREHQSCGYTHSETFNFERSDGRADVKMRTKWTQKGRLFLYRLLKENAILPMIERSNASV